MMLSPKKSLGQHFLSSPSALAKIIEAAGIRPGEHVLEIGPGTGVLTDALLKAGASVIAVEKDRRAWALVGERFSGEISAGRLRLERADILTADLAALGLRDGRYALVANIPYYITGAILERFLEHEPRPDRMVLLVQKEVADRIMARDGKESVLSVSVKAFGAPRAAAKVPRGAFVPPPSVDSAILCIDGISDRLFRDGGIDPRAFFAVLKAGFAHKRKYLKRNLGSAMDKGSLDAVWQRLGLDEKARAEDLSVGQWADLIS